MALLPPVLSANEPDARDAPTARAHTSPLSRMAPVPARRPRTAAPVAQLIAESHDLLLQVLTCPAACGPCLPWLDQVGYDVDIPALRSRYPGVHWRRFEDWAAGRDCPR